MKHLIACLLTLGLPFVSFADDVLTCTADQPVLIKTITEKGTFTFKNVTSFKISQNQNPHYATIRLKGKSIGVDEYSRSKQGNVLLTYGWQTNLRLDLVPVKSSGKIQTFDNTVAYAKYVGSYQKAQVVCELFIE